MTRFSLGEVAWRRRGAFPYRSRIGRAVYLPVQNLFVCRYLDWTKSTPRLADRAWPSMMPDRRVRNPLVESGYIAVSPS